MKSIKRALLLLCVILLVFTVGGAYATWQYAIGAVAPFSSDISFKVGDFLWEGSGDLPTEGDIGENHLLLINNIINHEEHGFNAANSYLNEQIEERQDGGLGWRNGRDTLGSMAVTQSEELTEIFGLDSSNLNFLIQFVNNNTYYLFTTGIDLGERGACNWLGQNTKAGQPTVPIGDYIHPIYKTVVEKGSLAGS